MTNFSPSVAFDPERVKITNYKRGTIISPLYQSKSGRLTCITMKRICQEYHNCFPFGELEETSRTSSNYADEDYPASPEVNNLSLDETITVAQNLPLWRLMSALGATHP